MHLIVRDDNFVAHFVYNAALSFQVTGCVSRLKKAHDITGGERAQSRLRAFVRAMLVPR